MLAFEHAMTRVMSLSTESLSLTDASTPYLIITLTYLRHKTDQSQCHLFVRTLEKPLCSCSAWLFSLARSLSLLLSLAVLSMLLGCTWSPRFILCCAEKKVHSSDPSEKARSNSGLSLPCCSMGHRCWGENSTVTAMRADCDCTSNTVTNGSRFTQILLCFDVTLKCPYGAIHCLFSLKSCKNGRWRGGLCEGTP